MTKWMDDMFLNHFAWTVVGITASVCLLTAVLGLAFVKWGPEPRPEVEIRHYEGTTCYIRHNRGIAGDSISCVAE